MPSLTATLHLLPAQCAVHAGGRGEGRRQEGRLVLGGRPPRLLFLHRRLPQGLFKVQGLECHEGCCASVQILRLTSALFCKSAPPSVLGLSAQCMCSLQGKGDRAPLSPVKTLAKVTSPQKVSSDAAHPFHFCRLLRTGQFTRTAYNCRAPGQPSACGVQCSCAAQAKASPATQAAAAVQAVSLGPGGATATGPADKPDTLIGEWQLVSSMWR